MNRVEVIRADVEYEDICLLSFPLSFPVEIFRQNLTLRSGQKSVNSARMSEAFIKNTSEHKSKYKTSELPKMLAK